MVYPRSWGVPLPLFYVHKKQVELGLQRAVWPMALIVEAAELQQGL